MIMRRRKSYDKRSTRQRPDREGEQLVRDADEMREAGSAHESHQKDWRNPD